MVSFVTSILKSDDGEIIWENDVPCLDHYCRTVKFEFKKEAKDRVAHYYNYYLNLIDKIDLYCFNYEGFSFEMNLDDIKPTMTDCKTDNVLTDQKASNCCNICGVGPKLINDINYVKNFACKENYYKFGPYTAFSD